MIRRCLIDNSETKMYPTTQFTNVPPPLSREQGHAELIALQRLDETCAQLQKQVILIIQIFVDQS
jgi:hypothetical protein